jgi:putative component of toxin-antitoxin plasmid stabilization module
MSDRLEVVLTSWYKAELLTFPEEDQDRIERKLLDFRRKGWNASVADGSVKHLRDGIHEFRILGTGPAFRVLFFLVPGRSPRVVVLTTCVAKSSVQKRQRLNAEVERAKHRRAEWRDQQRKRGNDAR